MKADRGDLAQLVRVCAANPTCRRCEAYPGCPGYAKLLSRAEKETGIKFEKLDSVHDAHDILITAAKALDADMEG